MFLCGPAVRHGGQILFKAIAVVLATALELPAEQLEMYRNWGMYLDDLSCCGEGMCMLKDVNEVTAAHIAHRIL